MESINSLLGPGYQVLVQAGNPIIVSKEPFESLGASSEYEFISTEPETKRIEDDNIPMREAAAPPKKTLDDTIFQFYVGSLSVVGLFMLYRFMQKNR